MNIPRFRNHIYPVIVEDDKVLICSEYGQQVLTGKSLVQVAQHLDGDNSVDTIIQNLEGIVEPGQVRYVLSYLEDKRYVYEQNNDLTFTESSFWGLMGLDNIDVIAQKKKAKIKIYSIGDVDENYLSNELKSLSINIVDENETFAAIITDDYLQTEVLVTTRRLWEQNIPFILAKPNGIEMWLGPIFTPNSSACFDCLMQRLHANRDVEVYLKETGKINNPLITHSSLTSTIHASLSLVATEVSKFIMSGQSEKLNNSMISFNYGEMESQKHTVVKRPQCRFCGEKSENKSQKIVLKSSLKSFTDGGHRSVTATETYEKFKHHISPISGIVKKLERISNIHDTLQHVYVSGQNMAIKTNNFKSLKKNLRSNSCGKGSTEIQAKVSAIGEAIERYSGVYRGEETKIIASFNSLGSKAIHPNTCMLYSKSQYENHEKWNGKESFFNVIPLQFDENAEIEWSPLWSITQQNFVYLPTAYCYYSHPDNGGSHFFCAPDSNGNAAGNTIEEAILQGFLELIERDSVAIWWYNRLSMPQLDLDSFNDQYTNDLRIYHKSRNRDLWVLDLTSDSGIPAYIAISARNDRMEFQDIIFAPAAHLNPEIALRRALTELNQMLPSMNDSFPAGTYNYDDPECISWWRTCNVENQPYLLPNPDITPTSFHNYEGRVSIDIKDDIDYCVEIVKKLGLEMHVLDQTRPDIGLNVVKVVVPGLRHFWARYAPGRLYDVPVKLGLIEKAHTEEEFNPISIFI
jgi:oxazoline/thiazoline synthase